MLMSLKNTGAVIHLISEIRGVQGNLKPMLTERLGALNASEDFLPPGF